MQASAYGSTTAVMQAPTSVHTKTNVLFSTTSASTLSTTTGSTTRPTPTSTTAVVMQDPSSGSTANVIQITTSGSTAANVIQTPTSGSTAANVIQTPTSGSTAANVIQTPTSGSTAANVIQTTISRSTAAHILQSTASGSKSSTTAGLTPVMSSCYTAGALWQPQASSSIQSTTADVTQALSHYFSDLSTYRRSCSEDSEVKGPNQAGANKELDEPQPKVKKIDDQDKDDVDEAITQENINYFLFNIALTTVCCIALREILLTYVPIPYRDIYQAILGNKAMLNRLNKEQVQLVYPDPLGLSTGMVEEFDISLLYTIIRNVSSVPAPSNGWGNPPTDNPRDTTLGASVERIRSYRNHIIGRNVDGKISQQEFGDYWAKIDKVLREIEIVIGNHGYQEELEKLKKQAITIHEFNELQKTRMEYIRHTEEKLHRTVLNRCLPRLMKDLDVWVVMKYIRQKQLFNAVTIRDISEQTTTTDKILYLIDQIKERDQHTYVRFKECLIRAQQADLKKMLDEEEENLVAEMKEKHRGTGNPLEAVRPVDVLLAIISDKSIETILQMTTSLQESEIPDIEIRNVSTHLQHIHEESLTESERRKEDIFKALFDSCKNDLLNILETGEHSDDILRSALQYILLINDPSAKAAILNVAGANLKSKLSNPDCDVWGGLDVRIDSKCRVSLVCLHRGNLKTQPDSNLGLPVLYQEYDRIEREPFEASFSNEYHTSISPEDLRRANILINKHGEELFKIHTNLVAISPSSVLSSKSRGLKIEPSIVLYCRMKGVIPIGENHFPKTLELEGIILSTDIREGLFTFAMHEQAQQNSFRPTDRNDKLRMGCSIGVENGIYSGTLGPFVRLGSDVGFITCAHVVGFDNQTIVQPAYGDSNETETACGTVLDVHFDPDKPVDAALIKVNNRDVAPTDFTWNSPSNVLNAGFDVTKPPSFLGGSVRMDTDFSDAQGKRVIKCGKVTGLTKGSLALNGTMIKIEDCALPFPAGITWNGSSVVVMKNQYQVENNRYPFGTFGDSGAGVYLVENEQNNLSLIGILIGFLNNNTVVTPIRPVLESLKLKPEDVISR